MKMPMKKKPNLRANTQPRAKKDPLSEKVNGVSVYTAVYKVNRSDELLEFLLRKCNTSRNNVKSLSIQLDGSDKCYTVIRISYRVM